MAKYKVLKDFVLNGINQKAESVILLDHKMESLKSIQAFIKKVPDSTPLGIPAASGGVVPSSIPTPPPAPPVAPPPAPETPPAAPPNDPPPPPAPIV